MTFVLDASVTMAWCFLDQATRYTESAFDQLWQSQALVPTVWPLEVANVLLVAERARRLTEADSTRFLRDLRALPIIVDEGPQTTVYGPVMACGRAYGLSTYDASYLELAMREGIPLATLDDRVRSAALRAGVLLVS